MDVRGIGAFLHFVKSTGLNGLNPVVNAFVVCMEEYDRLCACDATEVRDAQINKCRALYENFINGADGFKATFLSKVSDGKISFYTNHGKHIKTFSR